MNSEYLEAHEKFLKMKRSGALNVGRSTMSASSAALVKPYFDELNRTGQSVLLKLSVFGVGSGTLYRKILDGATFLSVRCKPGPDSLVKTEAEQARYQAMRATWRLEQTEEGFLIHPNKYVLDERRKTLEIQRHMQEAAAAKTLVSAAWREEFLEFLQDAPEGAEFVRTNVALMFDDREFVKNLCGQAGCDFDINEEGTKLVVIKND